MKLVINYTITLIIILSFSRSVAQESVKSINANFSVSLSGALTYQVPFEVPSYSLGHFPNLGLTYSSQAGDGIAGYGWNIAGLSSITRTSATKYHDNFIDGVDFDLEDRFTLDGQRLLIKTGIYGAPGATYQTESYSNLKIESIGTSSYGSNYGPEYFIVYHPNGIRYWYGKNNTNTNSHSKLEWSVARIEDAQGNKINFDYSIIDKTVQLNYVEDPVAKVRVQFYYGNKNNINPIAIGGEFFTNKRLLTSVQVKTNTETKYFKYVLTHQDTNKGFKRIKEIIQENRKGETLAPLKFDYFNNNGNNIEELIQRNLPFQVGDKELGALISGDFDGNEEIDFITYSTENADETRKIGISQNPMTNIYSRQIIDGGIFKNILTGTFINTDNEFNKEQGLIFLRENSNNSQISFEINKLISNSAGKSFRKQFSKNWTIPEAFAGVSNIPNKRFTLNYFSGDFDGDGITDILAIANNLKQQVRFCDPIDTDPGVPPPTRPGEIPVAKFNIENELGKFFYKKVETVGTNNTQRCTTLEYDSFSPTYLINLDPKQDSNFAKPLGNLSHFFSGKLLTGDFDGDGKTDIFHLVNDKITVHTLDSDNRLKSVTEIKNAGYENNSVLPGDYNGDGKTDLAISQGDDSTSWKFYISNGKDFSIYIKDIGVRYRNNNIADRAFEPIEGFIANEHLSLYEYNYIPVDFNKDGKTDIIQHNVVSPYYKRSADNGFSHQVISFVENKSSVGSDYLKFTSAKEFNYNNRGKPAKGHPFFADIYKRNLSNEYGYVNSDGTINSYKFQGAENLELTIKEVNNNNLVQTFDYEGVFDSRDSKLFASIYTAKTNKSIKYPYLTITNANDFKVLYKVTEKFEGFTRAKSYRYAGLVSATNGLGILGFSYTANTDWEADDYNSHWTINQYDPTRRGVIDKSWKVNFAPISIQADQFPTENFVSKVEYQYDYKVNPNKTYINVPNKIISENGLTGVKTEVTNSYDDYYNLLTSKETYSGGSSTTTQTYFNNPSGTGLNYYLGRPKTKNVVTVLDGDSFSTSEEYTYENNLIKELKTKGNNTSWLTETYEHDRFGNIVDKILSGSGIVDRKESSTYDETGRFMESTTDVEGLTTNYIYDKKLGHLKEEIDHFGKKQKFDYDTWDRLTKQTDYLGNTIDTYYDGEKGHLILRMISSLGEKSITHYNRLGWEERKKVTNVLGVYVIADMEYDAVGRVKRESQPYFDSPSQWTINSYDEYNRPVRQQMYTGQIVTTTYGDGVNSVSINDGTKTISTTKDAVGNTISMTDPGGTINYTYYANNTPKETNYGGHKIINSIDGWGRKVRLNDPAAGNYSYVYNILGELLTEYHANGSTSYTYDDFGKLLKKTIIGKETNIELEYKYHELHKQIERIVGINNRTSNRYTYDYDYDDKQRLINVIENQNLAKFEKKVGYDSQGRVEDETFISTNKSNRTPPNTVSIKNQYHSVSGQLEKISDNVSNNVLWQIKKQDERGQLTEISLGNGVTKTNKYDAYGLPKEFKAEKGGTAVFDLSLDFDEKLGNLKSRHNKAFTGKEIFAYDNQDRLLTTTINGSLTHEQTYENNGNIKKNSLVGTYSYQSTTKYRVAGIDLNTKGENYYKAHTAQQIKYNAYKKPVSIYEKDHGRVNFEYGPLMNRTAAYYGGLEEDKEERDYVKVYSSIAPLEFVYDKTELAKSTKFISYILGDAYSAPIAHISVKQTAFVPKPQGSSEYMYLHRDHLGSIMAITNDSGTVVESAHYSAWGTIEQFKGTNTATTLDETSILGRGYTGHEHFTSVGLIHMNGRMYDAKLGRFLSPDNFIQDPFNTQSFNRYGYVWNNPLKFNDPSGEFVFTAFLIGFAVSALIDYGLQVAVNYAMGQNGADAWFNNVDFFDVAVSGVIGGLTVGYGSSIEAGAKIGKFGTFLLKNKNLVKAAEIALTSAVDITGKGTQSVSFNQFGQRIATSVLVWGATEVLSDVLKKGPQVEGIEAKVEGTVRKAKMEAAENGVDPIGEALAKESQEALDPNNINFMQSSIKNTTGDFTVLGNAKNLANGTLDPNVLTMNVWKDSSGKIWTLNHRRLGAFKLSGLDLAPIKWASLSQVQKQMWKMTTKTAGKSIRLKIAKGNSLIIK